MSNAGVTLDYKSISENIWYHYEDKLTEWEEKFIIGMMSQKNDFSEKQKETILKINRKYLAQK